jgi:hypothetical protein
MLVICGRHRKRDEVSLLEVHQEQPEIRISALAALRASTEGTRSGVDRWVANSAPVNMSATVDVSSIPGPPLGEPPDEAPEHHQNPAGQCAARPSL